jgi:Family of unknown function (DUF5683)
MYRQSAIIFVLVFLIVANKAMGQTVLSAMRDTSVVAGDTGTFHMTKSPLEAVLLSAAIPGAGQVYLGQTWKLPILYGLIGGFAYGVLIQNHRYHEYLDSSNKDFAAGTSYDSLLANENINVWEFYQNDRDKWWIYLGITYIAQILDAYISANLYDFDVSNPSPSQLQSYYDPVDRSVGMRFTLHF